jgi:hypothetical protein
MSRFACATGAIPRGLARLRRLLPALVACVLAAALVFGGLRSGGRYFFCAAMGTLADKPCCAPAHADEGSAPIDEAALDGDDDCCERLDLARLPEGTARLPEPIRAAPLLAVLAPVPVELTPPSPPVASRIWRAATESPPPTAPERCAIHRVFLM